MRQKNKKEGTNPNNITTNIINSFTYVNSLLTRIDNNHDNSYKTFEYDNYGNIISIKHYDANNSIFKRELFTYIRKSLIETYKVYNQYNELILSYKYYYNYNNVRYKKENILNNTNITFNVFNSRIISNSRGIIYLYDENDSLLGFNYNDKTYTYINDETGNIVSIISDGKEVVRYIYDGYGNISVYEVNSNNELVLNNNSSFIGNINPYRYKDYYYDNESKLYYLNSRYYSSDIRRFISPDDISYIDSNIINGLNLYCYCSNNPVMYNDPDGCFVDTIFDIISLVYDMYCLTSDEGHKDWKNWVSLGFDIACLILPLISGGSAIYRVADGVDNANDIHDAINELEIAGDVSNIAIIGRDSKRVKSVGKYGYTYYDGLKAYDRLKSKGWYGKVAAEVAGKAQNAMWLTQQLYKGRTIVDIGKGAKMTMSSSYFMEKTIIMLYQKRRIVRWGVRICLEL